MTRIKMFLKALFAVNPAQELEAVIRELNTLAGNIKPLLGKSDRCAALVAFFNLTSPWHDRGLHGLVAKIQQVNWRGQYDSTIEQLRQLQSLFEQSGRNPYGWNRTKSGEVVTEHNVYLGNVFGVWTFTIAHFRAGQNERKNPWKGGGWDCKYFEDKNTFDVVSDYQARPFVQKNGKAIIEVIEVLESKAQAKAA